MKNVWKKALAGLGGLALVAGLSVGVVTPANAVPGSSICNVGSSTIYASNSPTKAHYMGLAPGRCAGNYIYYIVVPRGQCYLINTSTVCNNSKAATHWVTHTQARQWNVKRTR